MVTLSLGVGLVLTFLFAEITGLVAGGLIVPGYLALYFDQPARILATFVIAIATYGIVALLSQVIVIYGRRRFLLMVLIGFAMGWLATKYTGAIIPAGYLYIRVIGFIIPGLIANEMSRQGIVKTVSNDCGGDLSGEDNPSFSQISEEI